MTLADVDAKISAHQILTELEARADLASLRNGPAPDAWWAKRWGWKARDVHTLKMTCPRERSPLPWLP